MNGSKLVTKQIPANANNYTKDRINNGKKTQISEITIHHAAANAAIESIGKLWQNPSQRTSSHYGVNGENVGQYVDEKDAAWCNSNFAANCRAITIECANSAEVTGKTYAETLKKGDSLGWPVSDQTFDTLIKLVADCAARNSLHPLVLGKSLTWHSMYSATACPGPYLISKLQYIVDKANEINSQSETDVDGDLYGVMRQVIALTGKEKAQAYADKLNKEGDSAYYKVVKIEK